MPPTSAPTATLIEIGSAAWHKSSFSGASNGCIEHAKLPSHRRAIRDTKNRQNGAIVFASPAWQAFISSINSGVLPL
ncbi:DUF397 domain-containing protein [Streptomyces sp. SID8379]|uniref:DUF397 domain-containing protein n=1 Tax=unclassified Streptomyces TaxID=2593676 RepID=UPI0009977F80|nr:MULTISPECIES: DUF397 domain-containing protein [unclassified Streptomyces]MYW65265.1 DUF397 domain-containing protein [Streptomyces sp. SID8379]